MATPAKYLPKPAEKADWPRTGLAAAIGFHSISLARSALAGTGVGGLPVSFALPFVPVFADARDQFPPTATEGDRLSSRFCGEALGGRETRGTSFS